MRSRLNSVVLWTLVFLTGDPPAGFSSPNDIRHVSYETLVRSEARDADAGNLPDKCGLSVLSHAIQRRAQLLEQERAALGLLLTRPTLHASILVGSYRIHYDTTGPDAPAMLDASFQRIPGSHRQYVDSVAAIAAYTTSVETGVLGYPAPPTDNGSGGGPEYDIYIREVGTSFYGLTTTESPIVSKPDGGTFTTFIEIDNDFSFVNPDSNKGMPGLRVTLAHELHHAIQIGNYGYWTGDIYFYEITSVWMEDVVYSGVNDYYQYLRSPQGHFRLPDVQFTSNMFIMYSRGIWGNFVAKRYGVNVMRRAWEGVTQVRPLQAMENALHEASSSLRQAYSEWTLWNLFTGPRADTSRYYPEGRFYPQMMQSPVAFSPPSRAMGGSLAALSARYYQVLGGSDTLILVLSNLNVHAALGNSTAQFPYTYLLNSAQVDMSYKATAAGIFVKLDTPDPANWYSWSIVRDDVSGAGTSPVGGVAFPNPFIVDGFSTLRIPISSTQVSRGTLYIFTSNMDLVFSSDLTSTEQFSGQQAFEWKGKTSNGEMIRSGMYFFALDIGGETTTGKIAVIRK